MSAASEILPLGLSMLWESDDPNEAIRERFGFESLDAVANWVSEELHHTWDIESTGCSRMVISDQNAIIWVETDRGELVVKWSRARDLFPALDASTRLLSAVAERGVPVASPIATTEGFDRVVLAGPSCPLSVTVLPELTGDWLDVGDSAAVFAAGACLAALHRALGSIQNDASAVAVQSRTLRERVEGWLVDHDRNFAPEASRRLGVMLDESPPLDDQPQLVHNDFRAANILTRDSQIVGVLDFDDALVDHRVNDLAHACTYLGTLFTDWRPTSTAAQRTLVAGYESVRQLSPSESRWLEILLLWQGIIAVPDEKDEAGWAAAL